MNGINRGIHIDFHTPDGVYNFGENFDAKEFAKILKDANVTMLGQAKQVKISKELTIIVDGAGSKEAIADRVKQIRNEYEASTSEFDK